MAMKIDQVGRSAGVPGFARPDLLANAAVVTLTDTSAGGTTTFEILYHPPTDTDSRTSLSPSVGNDHVWTFHATNGVEGPWRIRLRHIAPNGAVTEEIRIAGMSVSGSGFIYAAPNERADPNACSANETDPLVIARCERNWPTANFPLGNPYGWSEYIFGSSAVDAVARAAAAAAQSTANAAQTTANTHHTRHENGGADQVSVAGLSGLLADPQTAGTLKTSGASVDVSAAAPPTAGKVLTATDATHATWQTPAAGSGGALPLWTVPTSPHADDEEFDSTTSPAAFTLYNETTNAVFTLVDGTNIDVDNPHKAAAFHTNYRRSYATFQIGNSTDLIVYSKPVTIGFGQTVWARMAMPLSTAWANNNAVMGLCLCTSTDGHSDQKTNSVFLYMEPNTTGNAYEIRSAKNVAGAYTAVSAGVVGASNGTIKAAGLVSFEYLGIRRTNTPGTNYQFYAATEGGDTLYLGTTSHASTFDRIGLVMVGGIPGMPSAAILRCDFIRNLVSATALPW